MNERQNDTGMTTSSAPDRRVRRMGTRVLCITAVLLCVLVALHLLLPLLPATLTRYDVSDNGMYTISKTTKSYLASLEEDVTVYVLCRGGKMGFLPDVLLGRYRAASPHVKVVPVDPTTDAAFAETYGVATSLSENSMIVKSERRYTVVDYSSSDYYEVVGVGHIPGSQYAQLVADDALVQAYQAYYGIDLYDATRHLALESLLTQAIEYVTRPSVPHIYATAGNGERALGELLQTALEQTMLSVETVDLSRLDAVPEDAASLLILAPTRDFSDEDTDKILSYLDLGGQLLLLTSPDNATMPNLGRLSERFGVRAMAGELQEGNANRYLEVPTNLIVAVNSQHDVTYAVSSAGYQPVLPNAHAIVAAETVPADVSVTALFSTSSATYLTDGEKEIQTGAVATAVAAQSSTDGSRLFWMSSADAVQDETAVSCGPAALYYLTQAAVWQHVMPESSLAAIEPVDLSESAMAFTDVTALVWVGVSVLVIPLALVIGGIVVRVKRERK